jgi:hypothetical protein
MTGCPTLWCSRSEDVDAGWAAERAEVGRGGVTADRLRQAGVLAGFGEVPVAGDPPGGDLREQARPAGASSIMFTAAAADRGGARSNFVTRAAVQGTDEGWNATGRCPMQSTLEAVRAEALFASTVQSSDLPTPDDVRRAITETLRRLPINGCAVRVAGEFGDHPDTAPIRMTWALLTVRAVYRSARPPQRARPSRPARPPRAAEPAVVAG